MKPRPPISTSRKCLLARKAMGMSQRQLAATLRLAEHGEQTVRRIERGRQAPPGPYQVAMEALLAGWRPGSEPKQDNEAQA